jgi:hypothetical protein
VVSGCLSSLQFSSSNRRHNFSLYMMRATTRHKQCVWPSGKLAADLYGDPTAQPLHLSVSPCLFDNAQSKPSV